MKPRFIAGQRPHSSIPVALTVSVLLAISSAVLISPLATASEKTDNYLNTYAPLTAKVQERYLVPPSVTLAQSILESGWGTSRLATAANSFFGYKCSSITSPFQRGCYLVQTQEWSATKGYYTVEAYFRQYNNPAESFLDYGHYLRNSARYAAAFNYRNDPDQFIREIKNGGYATDPLYPDKIIKIMRDYNLYRFNAPPKGNFPKATAATATVAASAAVLPTSKPGVVLSQSAAPQAPPAALITPPTHSLPSTIWGPDPNISASTDRGPSDDAAPAPSQKPAIVVTIVATKPDVIPAPAIAHQTADVMTLPFVVVPTYTVELN